MLKVKFLFTNNPANFYPALLAFAVAIGVVTPNRIRNYLFGVLAFFLIINQLGVINTKSIPVFGGNIPIIGLSAPLNSAAKVADIIELINESSSDAPGLLNSPVVYGGHKIAGKKDFTRVSVIGENDIFNAPSFSLYAEKNGIKKLKFFSYNRSLMGLSDFIIIKNCSLAEWAERSKDSLGRSQGARFFDANKKWFSRIFTEIKSYQLEDMSTVSVYRKKIHNRKYFDKKRYKVKKLEFAGFVFENIVLKFSDFDENKGTYKKVSFFAPYAKFSEIDIYGLSGIIEDFSFIPLKKDLSSIMPFKIGRLRILSAKISNYSIARYIENKSAYLRNVDVMLDKNFEIMAFVGGKEIFVEFLFKYADGEFVFDLYDLVYSRISMPNFILKIFHFKYSLDNLPFKMDFKKVLIRKSIMEIS